MSGNPIAKRGDRVLAVDTHVEQVTSPSGTSLIPTPHPFDGKLCERLAGGVYVDNEPVALRHSVARAAPHTPRLGPFVTQPSLQATLTGCSASVFVDGQGVARDGDGAKSCDDLDAEGALVSARATVFAG